MRAFDESTTVKVVVNDVGRPALWPAHRDAPPGWRDAGKAGTAEACLDWIEQLPEAGRPVRGGSPTSSALVG